MDLLMTATTAHIAEKTAEIAPPPPARKIELWTAVWAPETSEPETADGRDVDWQAVAEQSWIKLRPNASVPIAEETRLSQEQWFPRTATSYAAAPIAEETAASEEIAPPAGKIIGKIRALTPIGISKPTTVRQRKPTERPRITHIERAKTSNARCQECKEIITEGSLRFASEGQVFSKKFRKPDCVKLLPGELFAIVGWNSLGDPDEVDDIISDIIDAQQLRHGAGFMESPARKAKLVFEDVD